VEIVADFLYSENNGGSFCASYEVLLSWLVDVPYVNLSALMVLSCNVDFCKKMFNQRTQNDDRTSIFFLKKRKKALQIAPKSSAVISNAQKDSPLSHKGVGLIYLH